MNMSETTIKKALHIDKYSDMNDKQIKQFAQLSLIPTVSIDIVKKALDSFKDYAKMATGMVKEYQSFVKKALESNDIGQKSFYKGCEKTLDSLANLLERDNLSDEEIKDITDKMVHVLEIIREKNSENKSFIWELVKQHKDIILSVAKGLGVGLLMLLFSIGGSGGEDTGKPKDKHKT